ncbi:MAG: hypothetical protein IRZ16_02065 [Myxococcaceae bacterium]|nr:hypothetical protein [Myxococcaceae bacterium]
MRPLCPFVAGLMLCGNAWALDQLAHRWITEDQCRAAGFDAVFCTRVGVENGNVDAREWEDMAAHAQAESATEMCGGAKATLERLRGLGAGLRPLAEAIADAKSEAEQVQAIESFADVLGRAMHTFQDLCAHQGMTNIQHAWFSASDQCDGTSQNPDAAPKAAECAKSFTADVFAAVKDELAKLGVSPGQFPETDAWAGRLLPASDQLCAYLVSAGQWDGKDHRWELEGMKTATLTAFLAGWRDEPLPALDCATLEAPPAADVDVSKGTPWCASAEAVCQAAGEPGLGCGCTTASGAAVWPFAVLGALVTLWRRRLRR